MGGGGEQAYKGAARAWRERCEAGKTPLLLYNHAAALANASRLRTRQGKRRGWVG